MTYMYAVLGSGRQGTAAGYDMARWGDAEKVIMADYNEKTARSSADRINRLLGKNIAEGHFVDVTDLQSVKQVISGVDAILSAVPYYYNLELTKAAIEAGAHMADLGGNTEIVRKQHQFDEAARTAGVSIIPDCGQVPGLGTILCVYAMGLIDETSDVYMWDGGIPQKPRPPFNYLLTFNIAGLTNEYAEPAIFLRDGKITEVEPMTELEMVDFPPPIGQLEAFVAGGGTSTMPWTFEGKLRTLQNLTLRYPGNLAQLRAFWDLGLWSQDPVQINNGKVIPRDVFHALFEPKVTFPEDKDLCIIRVQASGVKDRQPATVQVEMIDYYDETTGFTAMERATAWSAALVVELAAHGRTPRGAGGVETFVPAAEVVAGLRQRGVNIIENYLP